MCFHRNERNKEVTVFADYPMVSIIIPVYNGSNYLKNAIDCALGQNYENLEVIVVNDGSCDDGKTEEVALSYGDKILYYYKENGGVSSALNYGIRMMHGEYFSWLSHDDAYSSRKISDAMALLRSHEAIGQKSIAYTEGYFISKSGEKIKQFKKFFSTEVVYPGLSVVDTMTRKGTLNGCCMLIPKQAFWDVGLFDENLRYSQDALMWYKIFLGGYSLISDNNKNVMNRLHPGQVTHTRRDLYKHDAVIIAQELAPLLLKSDPTGRLLYNYTKRLTRQNCSEPIAYLKQYAKANHALAISRRVKLELFIVLGKIRYFVIRCAKKVLLR